MSSSEFTVHLLWLTDGESKPDWGLGEVFTCAFTPLAITKFLEENLKHASADAWLFWDSSLGFPTTEWIQYCLSGSADAWHTGLRLGMGGQPSMINYVQPTWMLNRDPDPDIEATSWRLSLRACLVRSDVLKQLGGPDSNFESLAGAGLELGYRWIRKGAFIRHCPQMLMNLPIQPSAAVPLVDQLRFLHAGFEQRWLWWAGFRSVLSGSEKLSKLRQAWRKIEDEKYTSAWSYLRSKLQYVADIIPCRVSVLIPTLRRYPYLRKLLDQLRAQTVPVLEIMVIDQTPEKLRDPDLLRDFDDLPIRYFTMDQAGQCTSRNLGIKKAKGDFILFIDDDDEIAPDLIEKHLVSLHHFGINISNGVADQVDVENQPADLDVVHISSVFPTNNSMVRKSVLEKSGLFDLAYDHGQRADHDLGMRLYMAGEMLVLNPEIQVLHHHAPMGGAART